MSDVDEQKPDPGRVNNEMTNNFVTCKKQKLSHHRNYKSEEEEGANDNNGNRNKIIDAINKLVNVSDDLRETFMKAVNNDPDVEEIEIQAERNVTDDGNHNDIATIVGGILQLNNVAITLYIVGINIDHIGIRKLAEGFQCNNTIKFFIFLGMRRYDIKFGKAFKSLLQSNHSIENFYLLFPNTENLDAECVKLIFDGLKHSDTIENLCFVINNLDHECCNAVKDMLITNQSIKSFNPRVCVLKAAGMKILCEALELNDVVEEVTFGGDETPENQVVLNDQHLQYWGNVLKLNSRIKKVVMHSCHGVTDTGVVRFFDGIESNNTIEEIHLYGSILGPRGTNSIVRTLRNPSSKIKSIHFGTLDTSLETDEGRHLLVGIVQRNFNIEHFRFDSHDMTLKKRIEFYVKLNKFVKRQALHNITNDNCWPYILAEVDSMGYYVDEIHEECSSEEPDNDNIYEFRHLQEQQQLSSLFFVIQSKPDIFLAR